MSLEVPGAEIDVVFILRVIRRVHHIGLGLTRWVLTEADIALSSQWRCFNMDALVRLTPRYRARCTYQTPPPKPGIVHVGLTVKIGLDVIPHIFGLPSRAEKLDGSSAGPVDVWIHPFLIATSCLLPLSPNHGTLFHKAILDVLSPLARW